MASVRARAVGRLRLRHGTDCHGSHRSGPDHQVRVVPTILGQRAGDGATGGRGEGVQLRSAVWGTTVAHIASYRDLRVYQAAMDAAMTPTTKSWGSWCGWLPL